MSPWPSFSWAIGTYTIREQTEREVATLGTRSAAVAARTDAAIAEITERIVRQFQPERIILFGSQARGDADDRSDVDLLVVMPEPCDRREVAIAIHSALRGLQVGTDVIVTTPEEIARRGHLVGTILRPALREGRVLYARS